ncbi:MAG: hypothetical protein EB055_03745 [Micrococcales bacterium]|nr:hypothetical protein [Micrococcales bacterium]
MNLKPKALVLLTSVLLLAGCSNAPVSEEIPTPSPKPFTYTGETKTPDELFVELQAVDPTWEKVLSTDATSSPEFKSGNCYLTTQTSFQAAVDNDLGAKGDSYTYFAAYAQLGLILNPVGQTTREECAAKLPSSVWLPAQVNYGEDVSKAFRSSAENINNCLVNHAECFRNTDLALPGQSLASYGDKNPDQIQVLYENGFCVDYYGEPNGFSGINSCDLTTAKAGQVYHVSGKENASGLLVTEAGSDLDVLRWAASTSKDYGKYMIYGDGWAVIMYESTEKQKDLFLEMNKYIKGTLVARY